VMAVRHLLHGRRSEMVFNLNRCQHFNPMLIYVLCPVMEKFEEGNSEPTEPYRQMEPTAIMVELSRRANDSY